MNRFCLPLYSILTSIAKTCNEPSLYPTGINVFTSGVLDLQVTIDESGGGSLGRLLGGAPTPRCSAVILRSQLYRNIIV